MIDFYTSSTCGLAEELAGDEKKAKPATSSCGNVSHQKLLEGVALMR